MSSRRTHTRRFIVFLCVAFALGAAQSPSNRTVEVSITEGTNLSAAEAPDHRHIAIALLGRLWLIPAGGGEAQRIPTDLVEAQRPSWAPDGQSLAFEGFEDGRWHIFIVRRDGSGLRRVTSGAFDDHDPAWSHDGARVAFSTDRTGFTPTVWVVDVTNGDARQRSSHHGVMPVWTPNDQQIGFVSSGRIALGAHDAKDDDAPGIWTVDAAGHEQLLLAQEDRASVAWPAWSSEGRLAFVSHGDLFAVNQQVTHDEDLSDSRPQWISRNDLLYASGGHVRRRSLVTGLTAVVPFHVTAEWTKPSRQSAQRAATRPGPEPVKGIVAPAVSPDGSYVAFIALGDLWITSLGGQPARLTNDSFLEWDPAWSPDGRRLAFSSDRSGAMEVWQRDYDGGPDVQLTTDRSFATSSAWSPDGRHLAYLLNRRRLHILDFTPEGHRLHSESPSSVGALGRPTWSFDSRLVAMGLLWLTSGVPPRGLNQIVVHSFEPVDDRPVMLVSDASVGNRDQRTAVWSPNGRAMAISLDGRVWTVPVDSRAEPIGPPVEVADEAGDWLSWSVDSRYLVYETPLGLRRLDVTTGRIDDLPVNLTWVAPSSTQTIHAGHVLNAKGDMFLIDQDLVVERGVITQVTAHDDRLHRGLVLDASDEYVIPGLIEMNAEGEALSTEAFGRSLLAYGITGVRVTGGINGYVALELKEALENGRRIGPRAFVPMEPIDGPTVFEAGDVSVLSEAQLERELTRQADFSPDFVATRGHLSARLAGIVSERAHLLGLRATTENLFQGLTFGFDGLERLPSTPYRDVIDSIGACGISVPSRLGLPALALTVAKDQALARDPRVRVVADAVNLDALVKHATSASQAFIRKRISTLEQINQAGGRVTIGSDPVFAAGGLSLHAELEQLVAGGVSPVEAIRMATATAAAAIGLDDTIGSVAEGRLADLVILRSDPLADIRAARDVDAVVVGGVVHRARDLVHQER
jgi:Tol biopolymer transport system component